MIINFPIIRNSVIFTLLTSILLITSSVLAIPQYSKHTIRLLIQSQTKARKLDKAKEKKLTEAKQKTIEKLNKEKRVLMRSDNLDKAISTRTLLRNLQKSTTLPKLPEDKKQLNKKSIDLFNAYIKRLDLIAVMYKKSKTDIINTLIIELKREMLKMDQKERISEVLVIKQLLKKITKAEFSLVNFQFISKKTPKTKQDDDIQLKENMQKNQIKQDSIIRETALALGNNILSNNINNKKGFVYLGFAESLTDSDDKKMIAIREKLERKLFLPILPCNLTENNFLLLLEKHVNELLKNAPDHSNLLKYCVFLCHFNPALKKNIQIADFIKKSQQTNKIYSLLKFNQEFFGGSNEAEEILMQIGNKDTASIAQLLKEAKLLQKKYPKNKDVTRLLTKLSNIKIDKKIKPVVKHINQEVKCKQCDGSGKIEVLCPACKGVKNTMCKKCIGSGVLYTKIQCDACKGKGKTWLGTICKKCKGKGQLKKKKICPECAGKGVKNCPQCDGKGVIQKECPKCHGTGKLILSK